MTYRILGLALLLTYACGDEDRTPADAGVQDTSTADTGVRDQGIDEGDTGLDEGVAEDQSIPDAASDARIGDMGVGDTGGETGVSDTGVDTGASDTGVDLGSDPCAGQIIGSACDGSCEGGYSCIDGRCMPPSGRPSCGGFAGALCTTRTFPECSWAVPANIGPCLSSEEAACACAEHSDRFQCFTF